MYRNKYDKQAFTLIELAIIIMIVAVLSGMIAGTLKFTSEVNDIKKTEEKLAAIETALTKYFIKYKRLPCPADQSLAITASNVGEEVSTDNDGCAAVACTGLTAVGDVYFGAVPAVSLGLGNEYLVDEWDVRFKYAVDKNFVCSNSGKVDDNFYNASSDDLTVKDITGATIEVITSDNTQAIYVLASHGKNRDGGYLNSGVKLANSSDADEIENSDDNAVFVQHDIKSDNFDDFVRFKTRSQLIIDASYEFSNSVSSTEDTSYDPSAHADLVGWFDASDNTNLDLEYVNPNYFVTTWHNKKVTANDATQATTANKPTYKENYLATGLHGIYFDGVDDFMTANAVGAALDGTDEAHTIIMVVTDVYAPRSEDTMLIEITDGGTNYADCFPYILIGNAIAVNNQTTPNRSIISYDNIGQGSVIVTLTNNSSNLVEMKINGDAQGLSDIPSSACNAPDGLVIGSAQSTVGDYFMQGYYHEILIYNKKLSDADITTIEEYLMQKWQINQQSNRAVKFLHSLQNIRFATDECTCNDTGISDDIYAVTNKFCFR